MEGFLQPHGGDERGGFFLSARGAVVDIGLGVASWMHGRSLSEKNMSRTAQYFAPRSQLSGREIGRGLRRSKMAMDVYGPTYHKHTAAHENFRSMANRIPDRRAVDKVLGGGASSRLTPAVKKAQAYMKYGKFFRGMGIAFLMEGMFELGLHMSTPGITGAAQRSNELLLSDERGIDSSAAFTQRQRALQAIHDSQLTTRGIIGQEARYLHR